MEVKFYMLSSGVNTGPDSGEGILNICTENVQKIRCNDGQDKT